MKIILYKDVSNLGEEGDIRVVANGYARNYLIPQKFAVRYTKSTEIELAQKQQSIARRKKEKSNDAADLKSRIEALEMELAVAAGEKGKLFGSVTSSAIVDYLQSQGVEIERKKVELPDGGIKLIGTHSVKIKLYGGEEALLKVNVTALGDEKAVPVEKKQDKPVEVPAEEPVEEPAEETVAEQKPSDETETETEES